MHVFTERHYYILLIPILGLCYYSGIILRIIGVAGTENNSGVIGKNSCRPPLVCCARHVDIV